MFILGSSKCNYWYGNNHFQKGENFELPTCLLVCYACISIQRKRMFGNICSCDVKKSFWNFKRNYFYAFSQLHKSTFQLAHTQLASLNYRHKLQQLISNKGNNIRLQFFSKLRKRRFIDLFVKEYYYGAPNHYLGLINKSYRNGVFVKQTINSYIWCVFMTIIFHVLSCFIMCNIFVIFHGFIWVLVFVFMIFIQLLCL